MISQDYSTIDLRGRGKNRQRIMQQELLIERRKMDKEWGNRNF